MELKCYAQYDKFYVINNTLHPETIELIKALGGRVDEDGDYFWDKEKDSLYFIIYQLTKSYKLKIE